MKILAALALLAFGLRAQTLPNAVPMPTPEIQYLSATGTPLVGAKLCTYAAGTSTPLATYTDSTAGTPNQNPVTLDANGRASVWIGPQLYKFVLRVGGSAYPASDACTTGAVQWTQDNVSDTTLYFATSVKSAGTCTLITYTLGVTGAVSRTCSARLADSVSVKDFGAKGDGSTDDTAALQAGITYAESIFGTLDFPCGNYLFGSTLTISSRVTIQGQGEGSASTAACTVLTKTAAVAGIYIESSAGWTRLSDFELTSTASSGSDDGIVIGGVDSTNGASSVLIRDVVVDHHKGNGINVRNGNSGELMHVDANHNGVSGVLLSSQNTSVDNVNNWHLYSVSALSNTKDGIRLDDSAADAVFGADTEGNGEYGIYANRPYTFIQGYTESNTTNNLYLGTSCYDCFTVVHDADNTTYQGNSGSFMYNMAGQGTTPILNPANGRMGTRAGFGTPLVKPTYGASVTVNNDLGNSFEIDATDNTPFTVAAPSDANFAQRITVTINNASAGALGAVTWAGGYVLGAPWVQPLAGYSRSIDFQLDTSNSTWREMSRTPADVGSAVNHWDYVSSYDAPLTITAQTASDSTTAYSYPNLPVQSAWRTSCQLWTTTAGSAGTAQLYLQTRSTAGSLKAAGSTDLSTLAGDSAVDVVEVIPASTSGRYIGVQYLVVGNVGGQFSVQCVTERVQ